MLQDTFSIGVPDWSSVVSASNILLSNHMWATEENAQHVLDWKLQKFAKLKRSRIKSPERLHEDHEFYENDENCKILNFSQFLYKI